MVNFFNREYTCPKCGRVFKASRWVKPVCTCQTTTTVPDYDMVGLIQSLITGLTETQNGLIEAGTTFPGVHVCESEINTLLMEMATRHAKYQASHQQQGHQLFGSRVDELRQTLGSYIYAEIAAESWEHQRNDTKVALGTEMYTCWRQSPGHWSVASKKHKYYGADMALGDNGIWYACIIVAD